MVVAMTKGLGSTPRVAPNPMAIGAMRTAVALLERTSVRMPVARYIAARRKYGFISGEMKLLAELTMSSAKRAEKPDLSMHRPRASMP